MKHALPDTLLGMQLNTTENAIVDDLPAVLLSDVGILLLHIGKPAEKICHAIVTQNRLSMKSIDALIRVIGSKSDLPCVICSPALEAEQKNELIRKGIPFIQNERNAYLPFLGLISSEVETIETPRVLSPQAQRIFVNLFMGRWEGCTAGELAKLTGKSGASISKYLAELRAICPAAVEVHGKRRVLTRPDMDKSNLLDLFEPYLITPVRKEYRLGQMLLREDLAAAGAQISGESALSFFTDLAFNGESMTIAADKKAIDALKKSSGDRWTETPWFKHATLVVQEWAYAPDAPSTATRASLGLPSVAPEFLYLALIGRQSDDVRLADAIVQIRSQICQ